MDDGRTLDSSDTVLQQALKSLEKSQRRTSSILATPSVDQVRNITIPKGASSGEAKHSEPETLTVMTGTAVQWANDDDELHTVTSGTPNGITAAAPEFDSSYLSKG
jgi:plastocyanin